MESIKEIYKIGYGPSSSHTMGPAKAAIIFRESIKVIIIMINCFFLFVFDKVKYDINTFTITFNKI